MCVLSTGRSWRRSVLGDVLTLPSCSSAWTVRQASETRAWLPPPLPNPPFKVDCSQKNECLSFRHCICACSLRPTVAWFETGAAYPQHCQASSSGHKDPSRSRQQTPPTSCPRPSHSSYEQRVSPCLLSSSTTATHTYPSTCTMYVTILSVPPSLYNIVRVRGMW